MLKINKKDIQVKHFSIYSHDCLIIFLDYLKIKSIWPPPGRYYNFVISLSYLSLDKLWRSHSCNIPSVYSYDLFYRFLSLFLINRPYVSPSIFLSLSVLSYHSLFCLIIQYITLPQYPEFNLKIYFRKNGHNQRW